MMLYGMLKGWLRGDIRVGRKERAASEIMAVSIKPRIRIETADINEKSKIIHNMKALLENMARDADFDLQNLLSQNDEPLETDFIPADDEERPDLELDEEGPEITEDDVPANESMVAGQQLSLGELFEDETLVNQ